MAKTEGDHMSLISKVRRFLPVNAMLIREYERGYKDGYAAAIEASAVCHEAVSNMRPVVSKPVDRQPAVPKVCKKPGTGPNR